MKRMRSALLLWWVSLVVGVSAQVSPDGAFCSICPTLLPVVGLPNVVLPAGTAGVLTESQTCADTEEMARNGSFTQSQCLLWIASDVATTCSCKGGSYLVTEPPLDTPTEATNGIPVASPTDAPVAVLTESPVAVPVEKPVASSTEAPVAVEAPTTVTGSVSICLTSATLVLRGIFAETYLVVCSEFYLEQLSAQNVSCAFSARRLCLPNLARYLRVLQNNATVSPTDVATNVTSTFATGDEIENYELAWIDVIERNGEDFVFSLRNRGSAASQVYFATVQMVDAFSPTALPSFTPTAPAPPVPPVDGGKSPIGAVLEEALPLEWYLWP
jgi:hypothetical protein